MMGKSLHSTSRLFCLHLPVSISHLFSLSSQASLWSAPFLHHSGSFFWGLEQRLPTSFWEVFLIQASYPQPLSFLFSGISGQPHCPVTSLIGTGSWRSWPAMNGWDVAGWREEEMRELRMMAESWEMFLMGVTWFMRMAWRQHRATKDLSQNM